MTGTTVTPLVMDLVVARARAQYTKSLDWHTREKDLHMLNSRKPTERLVNATRKVIVI